MKTAEELGILVREVWMQWAREQPIIKEHWLTPWERLSEPDKDVDRRIGLALHAAGMTEAADIVISMQTGNPATLSHYLRCEAAILTARDAKKV